MPLLSASLLIYREKAATICFFCLYNGGFYSVPAFQKGDRFAVNKVLMFWQLRADCVVEHDPAVHGLVYVDPVRLRGDDSGEAVLSEGTRGDQPFLSVHRALQLSPVVTMAAHISRSRSIVASAVVGSPESFGVSLRTSSASV